MKRKLFIGLSMVFLLASSFGIRALGCDVLEAPTGQIVAYCDGFITYYGSQNPNGIVCTGAYVDCVLTIYE